FGSPVSACLHRNELRIAGDANIGVQLALKQLPHVHHLVALGFNAYYIAHKRLAEAGGELRRVVANLVGMRENDDLRLLRPDQLLQSSSISVRRVLGQKRIIYRKHFLESVMR